MAIEKLNNGDLMSVQRGKINDNFTQLTPIQTRAVITTSWSGVTVPYTQRISISGVTPDSVIDIALPSTASISEVQDFQQLNLQDGGQGSGFIVLRAFGALNTHDIPVTVLIRGGF